MTSTKDDIAAQWLAEDAGETSASSQNIDGLARCDAVMSLTPKLADHPDVVWAFDEARRLARSAPPKPASRARWLPRPVLAWGMAGMAASACLALVLVLMNVNDPDTGPLSPPQTAEDAGATPDLAPPGLENRLADIDPVMLITDGVTVDGRSLAVLPFTGGTVPRGSGLAGADAAVSAMYQRLMARMAATPGLSVIGLDMAANYSDTELTGEEIAHLLNVRGVVRTSVDSDGQIVSLDVRVSDAAGNGADIEHHFSAPMADMSLIENDVMSSWLAALGTPQATSEPPTP
jgi:hypothetical protein